MLYLNLSQFFHEFAVCVGRSEQLDHLHHDLLATAHGSVNVGDVFRFQLVFRRRVDRVFVQEAHVHLVDQFHVPFVSRCVVVQQYKAASRDRLLFVSGLLLNGMVEKCSIAF